ncbi:MAG: PepSY domain-containing protein [Bacteroidota bacterium]
MILKVWRYSHFALALSSSVFILLAALTGAILAFEPIDKKAQPFQPADLSKITLADLMDSLRTQYDEVLELAVDENEFVRVSVISMEEELDGDFYVDPRNGKKIGNVPPQRPFFEFMTNLHRSLFLKTTGRIFIGVTSFFLFLISLTGFLLFIQRQRGLRKVFSKIIKEDFAQYYHLIFSRWMLIPIVIISLSGVYLSLLRFSLLPEGEAEMVTSMPVRETPGDTDLLDFPVFRETHLDEVRMLEFPFTMEADDFFTLSLQDRQVKINQLNGDIVEASVYPAINKWTELSFNLHTGAGSIGWSLVLFLASLNILFFLYTGGMISYKRLKSRVKNPYRADQAEIVVLYGSENGGTREFAGLFQQALLAQGKMVYLDELNAYQAYPKMKELIIMTSTYGLGDPPANGKDFLSRFPEVTLPHQVDLSVVGFGSLAYPDFCQFALNVHEALTLHDQIDINHEPFLIHNKSYELFLNWATQWSIQKGLALELPPQRKTSQLASQGFHVMDKRLSSDETGETFLMRLRSPQKKYRSGDLLAVYPPGDPEERLYSIAQLGRDEILLSIRRHEQGVCSNFLHQLASGKVLKAQIRENEDFHFPAKASQVCMIANGTGIAPFLGMIQGRNAQSTISLYWGGRTRQGYELYQPYIEAALQAGHLHTFQSVFSRESGAATYVQELIQADGKQIADLLKEGGSLMICGSLTMEAGVREVLDALTQEHYQLPLDHFESKGQILTDCY